MPGSLELLVIALVALFVLGPERLPEVARTAARLLARIRNYGVTASKELRGVADLGDIEREVNELRRELERTRTDLRRAMRETVSSRPAKDLAVSDDALLDAAPPDAAASDERDPDAPDGRA